MSGDAQFAQSIRKLIPGTFSGSYKGAQPVVRALLERGPVANDTEVSGVPCTCFSSSGSDGPFVSGAPSYGSFTEDTFDLCFSQATITATFGTTTIEGGYPAQQYEQSLAIGIGFDPWNFGSLYPQYWAAYVLATDAGFVTPRYAHGIGRAASRVQDASSDPLAQTTGLAAPIAGDVLEFSISGIFTSTVSLEARYNGVTYATATDSIGDTQFVSLFAEMFWANLANPSADETLTRWTWDVSC